VKRKRTLVFKKFAKALRSELTNIKKNMKGSWSPKRFR